METSCSKTKVKSTTMIPDCQKLLRCELESLKCQLQAQTKAFEFLNHSVTLLEKESCLQQIKIQQLEGENWPRVEVRLEAGPVKVSQVRPGWEKLDEFGFQARVW